jgi:hypothetical protein
MPQTAFHGEQKWLRRQGASVHATATSASSQAWACVSWLTALNPAAGCDASNSREDENSYVTEAHVGALLRDYVVEAGPDELIQAGGKRTRGDTEPPRWVHNFSTIVPPRKSSFTIDVVEADD